MAPHDPLSSQMTALRRYRAAADGYMSALGKQAGLHSTDMSALAHLLDAARQDEVLSPSDLGRLLSLSGPATTAAIDRLERSGFVQRRHSAIDGRRVELHVAPAVSRAPATNVLSPLGAAMRSGLEGFTTEQLAIFEVILTTVSNQFETETRRLEEQASQARPHLPRRSGVRPRH